MKKPNYIILCIHKDLGENLAGTELRVPTDTSGIPLSNYWRNRIRDSKIDGCCSIKQLKKTKKTSKGNTK